MTTPTEQAAVSFQPGTVKAFLVGFLTQRKVAQVIKWSVYSLLLVNFGVYAIDDWQVYRAALATDAGFDKIFETFSATFDMAAWVGLVILLELETYILPDEAFEGWTIVFIKTLRATCCFFICYATYGFTANALDNYKITVIPEVNNLCDVADQSRYLQMDIIDFEEITSDNCASLSSDTEFVKIDENISLLGKSMLPHVQNMGWLDVVNACVWIVVVLLIELEVALQNADRFGSRTLELVRRFKTPLYGVLFINAGIWGATGYPIYAWDAFLWIVGFWAIELNLAEWETDRVLELSEVAK